MKGVISEPQRLRDRHDQADLVERIAGQAARDSAEPEPLSAIAMARIAARIEARRVEPHRLTPLHRMVVVAAFLLGIVAAASAAHLDLLPGWLGRIVPASSSHSGEARPKPGQRRAAVGKTAQPAAPALPEGITPPTGLPPGLAPAPSQAGEPAQAPAVQTEPATPAPRVMPGPQARPASPPAPERLAVRADAPGPPSLPSPSRPAPSQTVRSPMADRPATERPPALSPSSAAGPNAVHAPAGAVGATPPTSKNAAADTPAPPAPAQLPGVLKDVVRALRVEHAPERALALLDQHRDELAGRAFAEEALLLRVEAMLALGQRAAVLRLLDRTSLSELAVSSTLLITRGELRAAAHRCAEGIGDFDLVLAAPTRPPKQALLGRARCKQQLGDGAGAERDLARYRHEFPDDPLP